MNYGFLEPFMIYVKPLMNRTLCISVSKKEKFKHNGKLLSLYIEFSSFELALIKATALLE